MQTRSPRGFSRAGGVFLGLVALALAVAPLGCKAEDKPAPAEDEEPEEDPNAPCREALRGVWTWGSLRASFDGGAAIITYDGDTKVFGAVFFACEPGVQTAVQAEGYTVDIAFKGTDRIQVSTRDFDGSITLRREVEPDPVTP